MQSELNDDSEPQNNEPEKCEGWKWVEWDRLEELDLFLPLKNLIKTGYTPFMYNDDYTEQ